MSEDAVNGVIELLNASGFVADGFTDSQTVRIPTVRSPVFGGIGGELATFGGRRRFKRDSLKVTVGKRTTYFYRVMGKQLDPDFGKRFDTKDLEAIRRFVSDGLSDVSRNHGEMRGQEKQ